MTAEALGRRVLTRTRCVALGKLNSLDLGSLVYLMRRLDHILSAKVPFLVPSSIKCVCVGRQSEKRLPQKMECFEQIAVHAWHTAAAHPT